MIYKKNKLEKKIEGYLKNQEIYLVKDNKDELFTDFLDTVLFNFNEHKIIPLQEDPKILANIAKHISSSLSSKNSDHLIKDLFEFQLDFVLTKNLGKYEALCFDHIRINNMVKEINNIKSSQKQEKIIKNNTTFA